MTNAQGAAIPFDEPLLLVHAYLDGELDPANSLAIAIAQQIAADPGLGAEVEHIQALRHAVRERLPREPLPPRLRARIETAIGRRGPQVHPSWRALAASVVFAMALASGSTWVALLKAPRRSRSYCPNTGSARRRPYHDGASRHGPTARSGDLPPRIRPRFPTAFRPGPVNVPILCTSISDYANWFGGLLNRDDLLDLNDATRSHCYLPYAAQGFFTNGGKRVFVERVLPDAATYAHRDLYNPGIPGDLASSCQQNNAKQSRATPRSRTADIVEVQGRSDQGQVRKRLRKITELRMRIVFFREQADIVAKR